MWLCYPTKVVVGSLPLRENMKRIFLAFIISLTLISPAWAEAWFSAVSIATANTNRDGTGTLGTLCKPDRDVNVRVIRVVAAGTTTAGVIRIFYYDGSQTRLLKELLVSAITPSTSIEVWNDDWALDETNWATAGHRTWLTVRKGDEIRISTNNAESFNAFLIGE